MVIELYNHDIPEDVPTINNLSIVIRPSNIHPNSFLVLSRMKLYFFVISILAHVYRI